MEIERTFIKNFDYYYYTEKYCNCLLRPSFFLAQLETIVINNLPIDTIQIPFKKLNKEDPSEFLQDFTKDEADKAFKILQSILNYLTKSMFKISKERKVEIFRLWFFWIAGSNYFIWKKLAIVRYRDNFRKINVTFGSIEALFEHAYSILYEQDDLSCLFDYNPSIESLKEDIVYHPDILARAIASQSIKNITFLIDKGMTLDKLEDRGKRLLHLAFNCNNIEIFEYLIQNGCEIDLNDDVFYNSEHKKDFKFAMFLYFFREKTKINDKYAYEMLKFHPIELMPFRLYDHFNEEKLIAIFESLFDIGFDFNEISIIIVNVSEHYEFNPKYFDNSKFTQLMPCIYQKGIKPKLIKYFVNKFHQKMGYEKLQEEMVKILFHGLVYCQFSLICFPNAFYFEDLIQIYYCLLPLLNPTSLNKLKILFEMDKKYIVYAHIHFYKIMRFNQQLKKGSSVFEYFFDMNSFKLLDMLVVYDLFYSKDYEMIVLKLIINTLDIVPDLNKQLKIICCMIFYFLKNGLLNVETILNIVEIFSNGKILFLNKEALIYIEEKIKLICYHKEKENTLLTLSKRVIRNLIKNFSHHQKIEILSGLNIPKDLISFIFKTEKINEFEFNKIYN